MSSLRSVSVLAVTIVLLFSASSAFAASGLVVKGDVGQELQLTAAEIHDLPHAETCANLPAGVDLAYDGLVIEVDT